MHVAGKLTKNPPTEETFVFSRLQATPFLIACASLLPRELRMCARWCVNRGSLSCFSRLRFVAPFVAGFPLCCSLTRCNCNSVMYLVIQSAERSPSYLTERCLEFLGGFRQQLVDMTPSKIRYHTLARSHHFVLTQYLPARLRRIGPSVTSHSRSKCSPLSNSCPQGNSLRCEQCLSSLDQVRGVACCVHKLEGK